MRRMDRFNYYTDLSKADKLGKYQLVHPFMGECGSFTVGENSKIGAGSVVLHEVPPGSTVVGVPGRVVKRMNTALPQETMNQTDLPDPVKEDIAALMRANAELTSRLIDLEEEIEKMKKENKDETV